jgi:hypothetical protein
MNIRIPQRAQDGVEATVGTDINEEAARSKKNLRVRDVSGSWLSIPCQKSREASPIPESLAMGIFLPLGRRIVTPFFRTVCCIFRAVCDETRRSGFKQWASKELR